MSQGPSIPTIGGSFPSTLEAQAVNSATKGSDLRMKDPGIQRIGNSTSRFGWKEFRGLRNDSFKPGEEFLFDIFLQLSGHQLPIHLKSALLWNGNGLGCAPRAREDLGD